MISPKLYIGIQFEKHKVTPTTKAGIKINNIASIALLYAFSIFTSFFIGVTPQLRVIIFVNIQQPPF